MAAASDSPDLTGECLQVLPNVYVIGQDPPRHADQALRHLPTGNEVAETVGASWIALALRPDLAGRCTGALLVETGAGGRAVLDEDSGDTEEGMTGKQMTGTQMTEEQMKEEQNPRGRR